VIPSWVYNTDDGGHDPLVPISEPRGVPDDATAEWLQAIERWSALRSEPLILSHLTPAEIIAGDWTQGVYQEGLMIEPDYLRFVKDGTLPRLHIDQAGGEGLRVVNEVEYAQGVRGERETAVSTRWKKGTLREMYSDFYDSMFVFEQSRPPTSQMRLMLLFES